MNLRNIMKKPDPIAPDQPIRAGHERDTPAPRTRRKPEVVYPDRPTRQEVQRVIRGPEPDVDLYEPPRRRVVEQDAPDRDYLKLGLTILIAFFAIGGIAVGALLMTQPGTPNNLAWLHGENAVVLVCLLLMMLRK